MNVLDDAWDVVKLKISFAIRLSLLFGIGSTILFENIQHIQAFAYYFKNNENADANGWIAIWSVTLVWILISVLFFEKNILEKTFPGIWKNEYIYYENGVEKNRGEEIFEIKNKNEYNLFNKEKVNGHWIYDKKPYFKILDFKFDKLDRKKISFLKDNPNEKWHIYKDIVNKIDARLIVGNESNNTTVRYTRIE
jgi:hypothetical protein